jgi:hypothetical protein
MITLAELCHSVPAKESIECRKHVVMSALIGSLGLAGLIAALISSNMAEHGLEWRCIYGKKKA